MLMRNEQDVLDAKYLAKTYPQVDEWKKFVDDLNNPEFAGFLESSQDNCSQDVASQNLSGLLDILEDEVIDKSDDDNEEWSEMCDILQSQKSSPVVKSAMNSRSESPDLFGSDQDDVAEEVIEKETLPMQRSLKRKSVLDVSTNILEDHNDFKKSRLDISFENDNNLEEFEQYSRQNMSTPTLSILEDMEETPSIMPEYESMLSPALQQELQKFGLKVIPRRKAVPLLKHIYEETHPGQFCSRYAYTTPKERFKCLAEIQRIVSSGAARNEVGRRRR